MKAFVFKKHSERRRHCAQLETCKHYCDELTPRCDLVCHHAAFADTVFAQDCSNFVRIQVHFFVCISSAQIINDKLPVTELLYGSLEAGEQCIICPVAA